MTHFFRDHDRRSPETFIVGAYSALPFMTQIVQANEPTLSEVEDQFNLRQVLDDPTFFSEWQSNLSRSQSQPETGK
ncbi:hypothetical protein ACKFKF_19970 [Phormidesmis sp. 146-12]